MTNSASRVSTALALKFQENRQGFHRAWPINFILFGAYLHICSLNYGFYYFTGIEGQQISLISVFFVIAGLLGAHVNTSLLNSRFRLSLLLIILIGHLLLPLLLDYFSSADASDIIFWVKRVFINIVVLTGLLTVFTEQNRYILLRFARAVFWTIITLVIFSAIDPVTSYQIFSSDENVFRSIETVSLYRAIGPYNRPNEAAFSLVTCYIALWATYVMNHETLGAKRFLIINSFLLVVAVAFTGSRAGVLITLTVLFFHALNWIKKWGSIIFLGGILATGFVILILQGVGEIKFADLDPAVQRSIGLDETRNEDSNYTRLLGIRGTWAIAVENPFVGIGRSELYSSRELGALGAHNIYVRMWAEMGFLFGSFTVLLMLVLFRRLIYVSNIGRAIFTTIFLYGFFSHDLLDYKSFPYLLAAAVLTTRGASRFQWAESNINCNTCQ